MERTRIPVSKEMRKKLRSLKRGHETYDDVVRKVVGQYDPEAEAPTPAGAPAE